MVVVVVVVVDTELVNLKEEGRVEEAIEVSELEAFVVERNRGRILTKNGGKQEDEDDDEEEDEDEHGDDDDEGEHEARGRGGVEMLSPASK